MKRVALSILLIASALSLWSMENKSGNVIVSQQVVCKQSIHPLRQAAIKVGIGDPGKAVIDAVDLTNRQTGLSKELLLALIWTESSFNPRAVSSLNYHGLLQIPQKVYYGDANCLIGARILQEKLKLAKGDYHKAIVMYKGYPIDGLRGKYQANKVMRIARLLKKEV
jgi:soluble lytic murein transglycosylase-like protein